MMIALQRFGSLVVISTLFLSTIASQTPFLLQTPRDHGVLTEGIDKFIEGILSEWNSPGGIAVAVVHKEENSEGSWNVETKGYGLAKYDGTRVTEDTLFCIASNSKLFTTISAGLLISNQSLSPRISWDTKIASVIPEWGLQDPVASAETTIVDAMSHRTGLPRHDLMYGKLDNVSSILSRLKHLRPSAGFRETWQYNNNMYTTLSYLPSVLLRIPFGVYVKKHIFDPLGLKATTYTYDVAKASGNLADGFGRNGLNSSDPEDIFGRGIPRVLEFPGIDLPGGDEGNFKAGAGGVITSVKDTAIWLEALLLEGKNPSTNKSVIPEEVIRKVAFGVTVPRGTPTWPELSVEVYGGGQSRNTYRGHELIEHGGSTTGYMTQITRFPFDNFGVAVFSNDDIHGTDLVKIIKHRIIDEFFGLDPIDWNQRIKSQLIANTKKSLSQIKPRPTHPTAPSTPFESLAGVYRNLGYGEDIELCFVPSKWTSSEAPSRPLSSSTCNTVAADAAVTLPGAIDPDTPTFIVKWDSFWSTHLRLAHFDGNIFNATALSSRRTIPHNETTPFWVGVFDDFAAEFTADAEGGVAFGLTGGIWGAGARVAGPRGDSVRERAEVLFEKV